MHCRSELENSSIAAHYDYQDQLAKSVGSRKAELESMHLAKFNQRGVQNTQQAAQVPFFEHHCAALLLNRRPTNSATRRMMHAPIHTPQAPMQARRCHVTLMMWHI